MRHKKRSRAQKQQATAQRSGQGRASAVRSRHREFTTGARTRIGAIRGLSPYMIKRLKQFCRAFGPAVRIIHADIATATYEPSLDTNEAVAIVGFACVRSNIRARSLLLLNVKEVFGTVNVEQDLWDMSDFDVLGCDSTIRHGDVEAGRDIWCDGVPGELVFRYGHRACCCSGSFTLGISEELTCSTVTIQNNVTLENHGLMSTGQLTVEDGGRVESDGRIVIA